METGCQNDVRQPLSEDEMGPPVILDGYQLAVTNI